MEKLYNVYSFRIDRVELPELEASGLYKSDAEKLVMEIRERGTVWDAYMIDSDEDTGPLALV